MKVGDTVKKTVTGVVILKMFLFSSLQNMFTLLPINRHNIQKNQHKLVFT
jgi:hypothetical protein